jgi:hypothetical protein
MIIPLFGVGVQGKSSAVTSQHRVNLYYEVQQEQDKTNVAIYGTPGLTLRTSALGDTPIRGGIAIGDLFYIVHRGNFYEVNNANTMTLRGTLNTGSGRVDMAYNGSVIVIVDGTNGYTYTVSTTTLAQIVSANFPNGATTCTWLSGEFVVEKNSQIYISDDGPTWAALDFASAESAPDGIQRVFTDHGEIIVAGKDTTEFWGVTGAANFPFAPNKGATQEYGLAAKWSMVKFNGSVAAVMKNKTGQVQIMWFQGYIPKPISNQELDSIINSYGTVADATAYSYMLGGHPMLQVNFPSAGKSWLYDASTQMWSELQSGLNMMRHRGEIHIDYLNKPLIFDYQNGNIYNLDSTVYTDNGDYIPREITTKHIFADYDNFRCKKLQVNFEAGVGLSTGQGSDPKVMLQISRDSGHTYGNELWTSIGKIGKYETRAVWRRLGIRNDTVFKLRITDPIKVVITGVSLELKKVQGNAN